MGRLLARSAMIGLLVSSLSSLASAEAPEPFIRSGQRIAFLGDSNTYAGHYITILETWLRRHYPEGRWTLINLGLPGETASALSEPAHPYPRPCIHTRLESALEKSQPDVVILGYGTNDGIYYPFSEERFASYREGMSNLIAACRHTGAKIVLLTPPPFNPEPMRKAGQIKPAGEKEYAWFAAYEDYDEVMERYARWVLAQADSVDIAVDIRAPMAAEMKRQQQGASKAAILPDGIHYSLDGHRIVASKLWAAWKLGPAMPTDGTDEELFRLVGRRQRLLRDAWLTHVGHKRPGMNAGLPLDKAQAQADEMLKEAFKKQESQSSRNGH